MFLLGEESRMIQMQLGGGRSNVAKDEAKVSDMELCLQLGTCYGGRAARHSIQNLALSTLKNEWTISRRRPQFVSDKAEEHARSC